MIKNHQRILPKINAELFVLRMINVAGFVTFYLLVYVNHQLFLVLQGVWMKLYIM